MRWTCVAWMAALAGCSAIINPDESRLGGGDAGIVVMQDPDGGTSVTPDSGPNPSDPDSGPTPGTDGGSPTPDAGPPACEPGARCVGDTLVVCSGGAETETDCQSDGAFCEAGACHDWVCTPGEQRCTDSFTSVATCDERGTGETTTSCMFGCSPTSGGCVGSSTSCSGLPRIEVGGTDDFNLCFRSNSNTYVPTDAAGGCGADVEANGRDRTFVLTLERETHVVITLEDEDNRAAIDTVVYVRTACDEASTQIACDDDVGTEVRQARIDTTLAAGTYYIVADSFNYRSMSGTSFGCGDVRLRVDEAP